MKIQEIEIRDPDNVFYPLNKECYEDISLVYHGTSSCYTEMVEKEGWGINDQPYDMDDIRYICETFEIIDYTNKGYAELRPFTLGVSDIHLKKKRPSFTSGYWMARGFASVPGGETINGLFKAVKEFIKFSNSIELKQNHVNSLKLKFENYGEFLKKIKNTDPNIGNIKKIYHKYKNGLEMIRNKEAMNNFLEDLLKLIEKYKSYVENVHGIVYVLRIKPEWFKNWENTQKFRDFHIKTDFLATTDIGPENIIAKIIFPKGITEYLPASNVPLPLPWERDKFIRYLSDHFLFPEEKFLKKYLD